jgi:hypothetical protein
MAQHGIGFAILAPRQSSRVRPLDDKKWQDVSGGRIYPAIAYRASLPSGRAMNRFFYDGPIAKALAFEGLLDNGEVFASGLLSAFADDSPRLVHIATDGESYGHHHRNGEIFYTLKEAQILIGRWRPRSLRRPGTLDITDTAKAPLILSKE